MDITELEQCSSCGKRKIKYITAKLCGACYAAKLRKKYPEKSKAAIAKYRATEKWSNTRKEYESRDYVKENNRKHTQIYRENNRELCLERTREWRDRNRDHIKKYNDSRKDYKTEQKYGVDALKLMKECGYACQKCGSAYRVSVHHIDHNPDNNVYENFAILCTSCHTKLHFFIPERYRRELFNEFMDVEISDIVLA